MRVTTFATGLRAGFTRRWIFLALAGASLGVTPSWAQQAYPNKPVKIVGNFVAGGPNDIFARLLADSLQKELKQPFFVEAKPGAAGNLGADAVAKSPGDGYTLLVSIDTTFTTNPSLYASMPFTPADMKPVMVVASLGMLFGVNPNLGFKSLGDFVAAGKTTPQNFASAGSGSPGHIAMSLLKESTGVKIEHIPYKGNAPAVQAIVAGQVQAGIIATAGLAPQVQAGKVQALAVTSRQRSSLLPQVPTVAEVGLKQLQLEILQLVMVPASTPEPVVQTLQKAMRTVLEKPDMKARLDALDLHLLMETGKAATDRIDSNRVMFSGIIKSTGMKVD